MNVASPFQPNIKRLGRSKASFVKLIMRDKGLSSHTRRSTVADNKTSTQTPILAQSTEQSADILAQYKKY